MSNNNNFDFGFGNNNNTMNNNNNNFNFGTNNNTSNIDETNADNSDSQNGASQDNLEASNSDSNTDGSDMEMGTEEMDNEISSEDFYIEMISDELFVQMKGKSYKDDCTIPIEDLRYIHILHKNLEGATCEGEMVCHEIIAQDLLEIFEELYINNYPIERMELIDVYDADDETSMTANNSSCFNYRCISHTTRISKHGLGIAVDINPLYNPYTKEVDGTRIVEPAAGAPYLDREADFPYKIDENDLCYKLFTEHGFIWGGSWNSVKDYQHFELSDEVADELRNKYQ